MSANEAELEIIESDVWAQAGISAFDASVGKDDACLSPRRLVHILQFGPNDEEWSHLVACEICKENVAGLAKVELKSPPGFVRDALRKAIGEVDSERASRQVETGRRLFNSLTHRFFSRSQTSRDASQRAICKFMAIERTESAGLAVRVALMPFFEGAIRPDSLRLTGALVSDNASIHGARRDRDGATVVEVTFHGARYSPRVRERIMQRHRVLGDVRVQGDVTSSSMGFVACSNAELEPISD